MTTTNQTTNNLNLETKTIKLTAHDRKFSIDVTMDFNNVSTTQLRAWAFADRIIAMQRALRDCTSETLETFSDDGYKVHALAAGQKPKSLADTKNEIRALMAQMTPEQREAFIESMM